MRRGGWLLPCVLTAVAGCAVGPRHAPPPIAMPANWPAGGTAADSVSGERLERWWTAFNDSVLNRLVDRAAIGNLDVRIAAARVREARALRGIAAAAALPQVDRSVNYSRLRRSEAVPPFKDAAGDSPFGATQQNLFEAGFDASWEIDIFGGVRRDREAALAQVQASEEAVRDVFVTLLADVARTYVELRAAQRQLAILAETTRSQDETLRLVRARFDAGLATDLDVAGAEGLLAATRARGPLLRRFASEAIHRLAVLLAEDAARLEPELAPPAPIPTAPPELPATLPSELLSRRPDLRRAERELAAATARVGVARADLFPRFAILGNFGRRSEGVGDLASFGSQFWAVIPGIRWPLLSGGRIRANILAQDARQEQAAHAYEQAVLAAVREVADALVAHEQERERQLLLRASIAAHRRGLAASLERYTGGLESFLSVLDAQRVLYAADEALVTSERDRVISLIAVYKALGGGWTLDDPVAAAAVTKEVRP